MDSEQAFCDAAEQLQTDVEALADVDVVDGGLDAVNAQLDLIKSDAEDLANAGSDAAASQIDDLEAAVDALGDDLDTMNADPSADALSTVASDIGEVVTTTQALVDQLTDTCG